MSKTKRNNLYAGAKNKNSIGVHLIADFWFTKKIDDSKKLEKIFIEAVKKQKALF